MHICPNYTQSAYCTWNQTHHGKDFNPSEQALQKKIYSVLQIHSWSKRIVNMANQRLLVETVMGKGGAPTINSHTIAPSVRGVEYVNTTTSSNHAWRAFIKHR
jgi:hypothetical protein